MKYSIWILGAIFLIFGASCNILNPTANQVTIETSDETANACPIAINLDGNNAITFTAGGQTNTFPLVSPGSHTLNFSTSGSVTCSGSSTGVGCQYSGGAVTYSSTFNTTAGTVYVGAVTQGGSCNDLVVNLTP